MDAQKKSPVASERARADIQQHRRWFARWQRVIDPTRLIFVDEAGSTIAMTRTCGYAPRGQRLVETVPRCRGKVTTMIGAMSLDGMVAMMTVEGGTKSEVFLTFVLHELIPVLRPGDIVVLDNLPAHKDPRVRAALHAVGAYLMLLPSYSPDFNPIESAWAKLKAFLRTAKARNIDALNDAIALGCDLITPTMRWAGFDMPAISHRSRHGDRGDQANNPVNGYHRSSSTHLTSIRTSSNSTQSSQEANLTRKEGGSSEILGGVSILDLSSFPWHEPEAVDLARELRTRWPTPEEVRHLLAEAGVRLDKVNFSTGIEFVWQDVLNRAAGNGSLRKLAEHISKQDVRADFKQHLERLLANTSPLSTHQALPTSATDPTKAQSAAHHSPSKGADEEVRAEDPLPSHAIEAREEMAPTLLDWSYNNLWFVSLFSVAVLLLWSAVEWIFFSSLKAHKPLPWLTGNFSVATCGTVFYIYLYLGYKTDTVDWWKSFPTRIAMEQWLAMLSRKETSTKVPPAVLQALGLFRHREQSLAQLNNWVAGHRSFSPSLDLLRSMGFQPTKSAIATLTQHIDNGGPITPAQAVSWGLFDLQAEVEATHLAARRFLGYWTVVVASWACLYGWLIALEVEPSNILGSWDSCLSNTLNNVTTCALFHCWLELTVRTSDGQASRFGQILSVSWLVLFTFANTLTQDYWLDVSSGTMAGVVMAMLVGRLDSAVFGVSRTVIFFLFAYCAIQPLWWLARGSGFYLLSIALTMKIILIMVITWLVHTRRLRFYLMRTRHLSDSVRGDWALVSGTPIGHQSLVRSFMPALLPPLFSILGPVSIAYVSQKPSSVTEKPPLLESTSTPIAGSLRGLLSHDTQIEMMRLRKQLQDELMPVPVNSGGMDAWQAAQFALALDGKGRTHEFLEHLETEREASGGLWWKWPSHAPNFHHWSDIAGSGWAIYAKARFGSRIPSNTIQQLLRAQQTDGAWPMAPEVVDQRSMKSFPSSYATAWALLALQEATKQHALPSPTDVEPVALAMKSACDWLNSTYNEAKSGWFWYEDSREGVKPALRYTVALAWWRSCSERDLNRVYSIIDSIIELEPGSNTERSAGLRGIFVHPPGSQPEGFYTTDNNSLITLPWAIIFIAEIWSDIELSDEKRKEIVIWLEQAIPHLKQSTNGEDFFKAEVLISLSVLLQDVPMP